MSATPDNISSVSPKYQKQVKSLGKCTFSYVLLQTHMVCKIVRQSRASQKYNCKDPHPQGIREIDAPRKLVCMR